MKKKRILRNFHKFHADCHVRSLLFVKSCDILSLPQQSGKALCPERRRQLPTGWLCFHKQGAGRATFERFSPEALAERGNVPMTLTEILALLTFLVTTVYDTIDIVLRFREFRTKNGQKK